MDFVSFLAISSCQKQIQGKNDDQLTELPETERQVDWFRDLVFKNERVNRAKLSAKDKEQEKIRQKSAYINPEFKKVQLKVTGD